MATITQPVRPSAVPSQTLRTTTAATRVSFTWLGTRKSLTAEQRAVAALSFGAEEAFLSAGKKLLDTKHQAFRAVTTVKGKIQQYWKSLTLPFPEPGVRLINQQKIETFDTQMKVFQEELTEAVENLDLHYAELKQQAADRLGDLFDPADYPQTLRGLFGVEWEYPSIEPPSYLMELRPDLYEQECQRVTARFEEAVQLAEQAFAEELNGLVHHLAERLRGDEDGKPKVFRDSAVTNLTSFFERFKDLNVRSNPELDQLVDQAKNLISGLEPKTLRENAQLRTHLSAHLMAVQDSLDELMVDRPRRRILRRPREEG